MQEEKVDVFKIRFQKGETPSSDAVRSAFAMKLDLDENVVFVQMRRDGTGAGVVLPKDVLSKKFLSERDRSIWGPEGTGPARGWCERMAEAKELAEGRREYNKRTWSELWTPTKVGFDAAWITFRCKKCEHTWIELQIDYYSD